MVIVYKKFSFEFGTRNRLGEENRKQKFKKIIHKWIELSFSDRIIRGRPCGLRPRNLRLSSTADNCSGGYVEHARTMDPHSAPIYARCHHSKSIGHNHRFAYKRNLPRPFEWVAGIDLLASVGKFRNVLPCWFYRDGEPSPTDLAEKWFQKTSRSCFPVDGLVQVFSQKCPAQYRA